MEKPTTRSRKRTTAKKETAPVETTDPRSLGIAGNPNKYAPKQKIGTPTVGRSANYVETVGLGDLKVINAHGYSDVQSE